MSRKAKYSYYVEDKASQVQDRPRKFLEAFAAVLRFGNYGLALDTYARVSAKCGRCAAACQLYEATHEVRDIPCQRSELLLRIYRRYFTRTGVMKAKFLDGFTLTDEYLDHMAEELYRCTACRRCKFTCPFGIDHGLITHLGRWLLAEIDVIPKANQTVERYLFELESKAQREKKFCFLAIGNEVTRKLDVIRESKGFYDAALQKAMIVFDIESGRSLAQYLEIIIQVPVECVTVDLQFADAAQAGLVGDKAMGDLLNKCIDDGYGYLNTKANDKQLAAMYRNMKSAAVKKRSNP